MVELYAKLIIGGRRTIEQIPDNLRDKVTEKLKMYGYDKNGKPTSESK